MNPLWKWAEGNHKTGYSVFTIAWVKRRKLIPIPFDCYLIKYPPGASIPPHRDELKKDRHFRVNIVFPSSGGGEFICENPIFSSRWINFFRPDLSTHSVTEVTGKRTRYVLSFGWALKNKEKAMRN